MSRPLAPTNPRTPVKTHKRLSYFKSERLRPAAEQSQILHDHNSERRAEGGGTEEKGRLGKKTKKKKQMPLKEMTNELCAVMLLRCVSMYWNHARTGTLVCGSRFPASLPTGKSAKGKPLPGIFRVQTTADMVAGSATKQMSREIESERTGRGDDRERERAGRASGRPASMNGCRSAGTATRLHWRNSPSTSSRRPSSLLGGPPPRRIIP